MKNIFITTDNTCDLSLDILAENDIATANLHYFLDGVE